jgi:dTDP-4-amino-4,6-dideoxygalactose transaminase
VTLVLLGGTPAFAKRLEIVRPVFPSADRLQGRFAEALRSGQVTNMGRYSRELETRLAEYVGAKYCAAFCNGESALIAMLHAAGLPKGAGVITPAYTFSGTAHAIAWNGLTPIFADIDPETWTLDVADAESRIKRGVKAILAAPLYGNPCDIDALTALAQRKGLRLFFDSASGCGSRYRNRPLGGFGEAEMFSLHATKVFTTMEGGAVVTNNRGLHEAVCMIRNFGKSGQEADCTYAGLNGKMTEIAALVGLELLPQLDAVVAHRDRIAARYRSGLDGVFGLTHQRVQRHGLSSWLYYQFLVDPDAFGLTRDELIVALERENIAARRFNFPANHQLTCYRSPKPRSPLPAAEHVASHSVALPLYSDMTSDEVDGIVACVRAIYQERDAVRQRLRQVRVGAVA